jgi:putative iron-regulated protein
MRFEARLLALALLLPLPAPAADLESAVVSNYALMARAAYEELERRAVALEEAAARLAARPSGESLRQAQEAWIAARRAYAPTEVFRFSGGPIDQIESLINAWPLDESYLDYVEGDPGSGIINRVDLYPELDARVLVSLNEKGGEKNIAAGFHAIEFLLWGQDRSTTGPGDRPWTDYAPPQPGALRRARCLQLLAGLLRDHARQLSLAWKPGQADNFAARFLASPPRAALGAIFTGLAMLAGHELAGERLAVAYESGDQEDEESCFSDNTLADLKGSAAGIRRILAGEWGEVRGPGLEALITSRDPVLAGRLGKELEASAAALEALAPPFDQALRLQRPALLSAIEALEAQARTLVAAAALFGVVVNL